MSLLIPIDKPLPQQKKIAEDILAEAFARDYITMEELEKRLSTIHSAGSNRDIQSEITDLPANILSMTSADNYPIDEKPTESSVILSSKIIRGNKLKKRKVKVRIILGDQKFDYSKTVLPPGKYYINASVILGSLEIIIPKDYSVTIDMGSVLSSITERHSTEPKPGSPEIIITGKVVLGSVLVKVKKDGFLEKVKKLLTE